MSLARWEVGLENAVVLRVFLRIRFLQSDLRSCLATAQHGQFRSDHSDGLDRLVGLHDRAGFGLLAGGETNPAF